MCQFISKGVPGPQVKKHSRQKLYTVTQLASIHHPAGGDENDVQFTINYLVTDSTGDSVEGSFSIDGQGSSVR